MQTIPCYCRAGGIIDVCYFSQMWWLGSFFVFSQLSNHLHHHMVQSLHQPISLWVVGHGLQLLHAKNLAHFIDYTTHQASTSVTQKPGQGSKDGDVTLVQELSNSFCSLIRGHICQYVLCGVVLEHQDVNNSWWLVWLKVASILVKSTCRRSRGAVAMMGCKGPWAMCPHVVNSVCRSWWIATSGWESLATKNAPAIRTRYGHSPDVLHLDDIHSEQQPNVPLGPQRAANLHSHP